MTLTPQDIQTKQFHVRFRGFDVEEVDAFLERIAEEFLILIQESKQLKDRMEMLTKEVEQHKEQEKKFQDAILSAHTIADEMKEKSKKESEKLISSAQEKIEKMQGKAHEQITGLESTIVNLKELKDRVHDDVRNVLETYLDNLEKISQGVAIDYLPEIDTKALPPSKEIEEKEGEGPEEYPEAQEMTEEAGEETLETEMDEQVIDADAAEGLNETEIFSEPEPAVELEKENQDEEDVIPDLEGEMLFSVEDPLDELESDLTAKDRNDKNED